jgi:hypothetical protein
MRIMTRTAPADPFLKDVLDEYIRKYRSITKLVQNSEQWVLAFRRARDSTENCEIQAADIKHLRYAKQRVDSEMTPTGRFILFFDALTMTAINIATLRRGKAEGREADAYLRGITEEKVLSVAMWADGGDEALLLARFLDTEKSDSARIGGEVDDFIAKVSYLFVHANVVNSGYTAAALRLLMRKRTFRAGDAFRSIGGPTAVTEAIKSRCLCRMQNWVVIAVQVVNAEFPEWEVLMLFRVMDLSHELQAPAALDQRQRTSNQANRTEQLQRLAHFFGLDARKLGEQFGDYAALVLQEHKAVGPGATWMSSWQAALQRVLGRADRLRQHPNAELLCVVARYLAWSGCTTSGVEQTFSVGQWLLPQRRKKLGSQRQEDEILLVKDKDRSLAKRNVELLGTQAAPHLTNQHEINRFRLT